jgi:hypothetical protein
MKRNTIYFISTFLLLLAQLLSAQNLKRFEPDYLNSENCYPTHEEIKKFKIKAIVIKSNQGLDTIRYNIQTGLIDSKWFHHKQFTEDWSLYKKVINYYTKSRLDSSVETKYNWRLTGNNISKYKESSNIIQFDSLNREILWNHFRQFSYIDSGNTQYKVTKLLGWKKEDVLACSNSKLEVFGADTSKYRYDNKNRLISKATSYGITKYKYQNDTIIIIKPASSGFDDCVVKENIMVYKNGRLIKDYAVEKPSYTNKGVPCNDMFETNYTYKNGLINKITTYDSSYPGEKKYEIEVEIITK